MPERLELRRAWEVNAGGDLRAAAFGRLLIPLVGVDG
jgi:hypothetical protein